jgi:hypothetical protein
MTAQVGYGPESDEAGSTPGDASGRQLTVPRLGNAGPWTFTIPRPVWQGTIAFAAYLVVWVIGWASPLVFHAHDVQLDQQSMDPNFYVWSLRWWPYAIAHGLNPLHTSQLGAPNGFNLTWTTTVPPLALLASPLTLIMGPIVAFNLLTAIAPPLSGFIAFLACRRLTGKFWPALAGGACYGFSAFEVNHAVAGQLNLTWNVLPPLMVYLVLLWRDGKLKRWWFVGLLGLLLLVQLALFLEVFFQLTVLLAIGLPVAYALAGHSGRARVASLATQVALAYAAALVVASPYLLYALAHYPKGFTRSPAETGFNLADLVVPRVSQTFGIGWLARIGQSIDPISAAGYIGLPALLIVLAVAIWTWPSRLTRYLVVMFVIIVVIAVGPVLVIGSTHFGSLPWSRLWFVPVARSALPNRFMLLGDLVLALIVATWLATPLPGRLLRVSRWLLAALAVLAILADIPTIANAQPVNKSRIPAFFSTGEYRHYIKPGQIVLVISTRGNAGMLFQADTNFYMRISGGYINMAITPRSDLPRQVSDLAHATRRRKEWFLAYLTREHINFIVVEKVWSPLWTGVLGKMGLRHRTIGGVQLYRIGRLSAAGPCSSQCPKPGPLAHRKPNPDG